MLKKTKNYKKSRKEIILLQKGTFNFTPKICPGHQPIVITNLSPYSLATVDSILFQKQFQHQFHRLPRAKQTFLATTFKLLHCSLTEDLVKISSVNNL